MADEAVKVCVRVRPLIEREETAAAEKAQPVQLYWKAEKKSIQQIDDGNPTKSFGFDRVFSAEESTNQLYQDFAKPLVVSAVEGYNGTIFAYGQTSSGKTFTMMGSKHAPGVIPLAMEEVFRSIKTFPKKEFLLRVSYMEIYNETVTDLLVDSWKRKPLEVREAINKNIYVADLTEELVNSPAQVLAWIQKGEKNRHYGKTKMNERSSRSHTIFRMILESRERNDLASGENADAAIIVSHLNLVDLAGSERASQTGAQGTRFKEGCNINRSLFTLGQVIKKLSESQSGFTNYRDSKLTRILQNSLGGNAKTVIICTITPVALDETLSTLQFASAAKNMKNDPHVTEVSDDGALLKRYRNEIVDLKRRLQEVSSVTQTTATEKEVLAQLLQEKDQLQREQEDRIRNLTKFLVTSANSFPVQKGSKRRVTWGGKLPMRAQPSDGDVGLSDLSFADSFTRKRKADLSCLTELAEDDEDYCRWEIPEEPSFDMEMSQSSVTVRSFDDSPKIFISPNRLDELSDKVSNLQQQLEIETNQKDQAMTKVETLDGRVTELELQLETEAHQKSEALEKLGTVVQSKAELDLQLKTEVQQKLEAIEKAEMLEFRVADLEKQVEEQTQMPGEADDQMNADFAETIQLCETLVLEKEAVVAERDCFKEQLDILKEKADHLEKELGEKKELDEFTSLEESCRKEYQLLNENSSLRKAVESSELKCQDLESDKDLVQQVKQLRRSLDDAEGLSLDTKKEWAVLRSQNIALKERDETLTASYEKMEAEVNGLCSQLEAEKSRYKKMQTDLQKELNVAFTENDKLHTLLDGKVPKNLIDSVELERTVAKLNLELAACREAEAALQAQLVELPSLKDLPDKVRELTEELCAVRTQRDSLLSTEAQTQEEAQQLRDSLQTSQDEFLKLQGDLSSTELREKDLIQRCADATEQLAMLRSDLERSHAEKSQLLATAEETSLRLDESDRQQGSLGEKLDEMQQLMKGLEEKLADSELSRSTEEEIGKELQEQLNQLTVELESVRAEKEQLVMQGQPEETASSQSSAEEMEKLLSEVASLTEERDQLKLDIQENVAMLDESDRQRGSLSEKLDEMQQLMKDLEEKLADSELSRSTEEEIGKELQEQLNQLTVELESVRAEKEQLVMQRQPEETASSQSSAEEMEKLLSEVASLTEERDQLKVDIQENVEMTIENQEELRTALERNRNLKEQIKHLETAQMSKQDNPGLQPEELQNNMKTLTEELESVQAERDALLSERSANLQSCTEEFEKLLSKVTSLTEERDQLQEILEGLRQEKTQLKAELEEKMEMVEQLHTTVQTVTEQKSQLENDLQRNMEKIKTLTEELENIQAERDHLSTRTASPHSSTRENYDELLFKVTSLTEERDQLQEILEGLRQERNQLKAELEERMDMIQQLEDQLESTKEKMSQLKTDLQENVEMTIENQEELRAAQEKIKVLTDEGNRLRTQKAELECRPGSGLENTFHLEELQNQIQRLTVEMETVRAERDSLRSERATDLQTSAEESEKLLCKVTSLTEERDQLQETLETLRQEEVVHKAQLEETLQTEMSILTGKLESVQAERDCLLSEKAAVLQSSTEELEKLLSKVTSLTEERNQLQEILEGLRQEENQLKTDLEERVETIQRLTVEMETVRAERDSLRSERATDLQMSAEESEKLLCKVTSLTEERDQLQETLERLRQEGDVHKAQLEETLQTEISAVQEKLKEQERLNSEQQAEKEEQEAQLQLEMSILMGKLESVQAERDNLLSEKAAVLQSSTEELEKLLSRVTSLTEERNQLQEILEGLRQEENQLKTDLEERVETISAVQEKLKEQERLNLEQQAEKEQQEAQLHQDIQRLKAEQAEENSRLQKDLQDKLETVQQLEKELQTLGEGVNKATPGELSSRLQDSTLQLQESFNRFELFMDSCTLDKALPLRYSLMDPHLYTLPKPTLEAYKSFSKLCAQTDKTLLNTSAMLRNYTLECKEIMEDLVQKDLAVFEERRLQDVLLCRVQAPSYSVKDEDLQSLWQHRLSELLDKRDSYLQKMACVLDKLWANMATYRSDLSDQLRERGRSNEQLQAVCSNQPLNLTALDSILSSERTQCYAAYHSRKAAWQRKFDEHGSLNKELEQLEEQAETRLREERLKTTTLLEKLETAPVKTEADLLQDNKQLVLQLQQSEKEVKALCVRIAHLEEARNKANDRVSNHKQATQLLQTELQDSCAQIEEKENTIQTLKKKLRETKEYAKKSTSPSAIELRELQAKVERLKMELTAASSKHQDEIQRLNTLLNVKEESLRKLKETLRKSQQQGDESFLQGGDLYAKLTHPRDVTVQSSVLLEKTKLEEEVKQLQLKITQLESSVSSNQAETVKWKTRAVKLKRSLLMADKPSSLCTPTKRLPPATSEDSQGTPQRSPRTPTKRLLPATSEDFQGPLQKRLYSPKGSLLDSPKSKFFDVNPDSASVSRPRCRQFFDNSSLGTIPVDGVSIHKTLNVAQNVTQNVAQNVTQNVAQNVTQNVAQNVTQNVAQNVTQNVAQNVTQNVAQNVTQNVTQNVAKNITELAENLAVQEGDIFMPVSLRERLFPAKEM
ncbi:uncharacterized protein ACN63O_014984 [Diretmus argenteus]